MPLVLECVEKQARLTDSYRITGQVGIRFELEVNYCDSGHKTMGLGQVRPVWGRDTSYTGERSQMSSWFWFYLFPIHDLASSTISEARRWFISWNGNDLETTYSSVHSNTVNNQPKSIASPVPAHQEEKGATEDETVRWHHQLNGQAFEQTQLSEWTSSIPFTGPSKTIKWLGIRATKEVKDLYFENYGVAKSRTRLSDWTRSDDTSASLFISAYACSQLCSLPSARQPAECNPGFGLKAGPRAEKPAHPRQLLKALRIFPNRFLNSFNTWCQHVVTGRVDVLWAGKVSNAEQVAIVLQFISWCFFFFFFIRHEKGKALTQSTLAEPQACVNWETAQHSCKHIQRSWAGVDRVLMQRGDRPSLVQSWSAALRFAVFRTSDPRPQD